MWVLWYTLITIYYLRLGFMVYIDNYILYEEKKIHSEANKIKQASHAQFLLYSMILFIKVVSHDSTHCEEQIYAPCVSNQKSKHSGLSPQTVDFF